MMHPRRATLVLAMAMLLAVPEALYAQGLLSRLREQAEQNPAPAATTTTTDTPRYVLVDLDGQFTEKGISGGFSANVQSTRSLIIALRDLAEDDDVAGVVVRIHQLMVSPGTLEEIRAGLATVAKAKPVHAFLTSDGPGGLYLASAATTITIPPSHDFYLNGMGVDLVFMKRMLERLGIEVQVARAGKYKDALVPFSQTTLDENTREAYRALVDSLYNHIVGGITEGRKLPSATVSALMATGLLSGEQAQEAKLVDFREGEQAFYERIAAEAGGEFTLVTDYKGSGASGSGTPRLDPSNPFAFFTLLVGNRDAEPVKPNTIALVYLEGMIVDGGPEEAALEDEYISAYPVVDMLDQLTNEDNVVAVVLRIDSGGGSAIASDQIYESVVRLRDAKPVVVSMSNVAASGGYYIAAPAHHIIAQSMTITGSIGVIGGKFVMSGLYDWMGLDFASVTRGRNVDLFNTTRPWNDRELDMINTYIDSTYQLFLERVADGRKMTVEQVHEVAQGRVWSGADALDAGLIDEVGGLLDAFAKAKELAGLDVDQKYPLRIFPRKLSLAEVLERAFGSLGGTRTNTRSGVATLGALERTLGPSVHLLPAGLVRHAEVMLHILQNENRALMMPEFLSIRLR